MFINVQKIGEYFQDRADEGKPISKVPLSSADIETVLQTAMLDGKVEKRLTDNMYRAATHQTPQSSLTSLPCFLCPMRFETPPLAAANFWLIKLVHLFAEPNVRRMAAL